jgi:hypothetical protein
MYFALGLYFCDGPFKKIKLEHTGDARRITLATG